MIFAQHTKFLEDTGGDAQQTDRGGGAYSGLMDLGPIGKSNIGEWQVVWCSGLEAEALRGGEGTRNTLQVAGFMGCAEFGLDILNLESSSKNGF